MPRPKNTLHIIVLLFAWLVSFDLEAQQFKGEASVAKDTFIVGDSIGIKINIQGESGHIFRLQEIPQLQGLEWLDSNLLQQDFTANTFTLPLIGFDSGSFTLPRLVFDVFNADNNAVATAQTQPLAINITYAQVDTTKDIKPIKAPMEVDYSPFPVWPYILLAVVLLALAYYFYRRWKKKKAKPAEQPVPEMPVNENKLSYAEEAIKQIKQLQQDNTLQNNEQQYWFGLKEILRTYINKHYKLRTQEKTSAQILAELKKKTITPENIDVLNEVFNQADLVLFAKHKPETGENNAAAEKSVLFIRSTINKEKQADSETKL